MASTPKTVAFIGASGGIGLATLRHTLAAGYRCIALCRDPSKMAPLFPELALNDGTPSTVATAWPLSLIRGNAHDINAVEQCLVVPGEEHRRFVDVVVSSIGGKLIFSKMTLDDPNVCANGMATLLSAVHKLRAEGVAGTPRIVAVSTTGISKHGRDVPLAFLPMYHGMLRVPHADKRVMEEKLVSSGEMFTLVRPSLLVDSEPAAVPGQSQTTTTTPATTGAALTKDELKEYERKAREDFKALKDKHRKEGAYQAIRVGIEDPVAGRRESSAVGYTTSRADAGRWMAENLLLPDELPAKYARKIATITY